MVADGGRWSRFAAPLPTISTQALGTAKAESITLWPICSPRANRRAHANSGLRPMAGRVSPSTTGQAIRTGWTSTGAGCGRTIRARCVRRLRLRPAMGRHAIHYGWYRLPLADVAARIERNGGRPFACGDGPDVITKWSEARFPFGGRCGSARPYGLIDAAGDLRVGVAVNRLRFRPLLAHPRRLLAPVPRPFPPGQRSHARALPAALTPTAPRRRAAPATAPGSR